MPFHGHLPTPAKGSSTDFNTSQNCIGRVHQLQPVSDSGRPGSKWPTIRIGEECTAWKANRRLASFKHGLSRFRVYEVPHPRRRSIYSADTRAAGRAHSQLHERTAVGGSGR